MTARRLPAGGRVDRAAPLPFRWDGREMTGLAGDSLASALMAGGVRVVGRGFKYHRPRGIMAASVEEGGALVTLGRGARRVANMKAPCVELVAGLEAFGQNAWPSVRFDLGAVNDLLGRFFAAGFYYKTFFGVTGRGTWEWMRFEALIRRAAGMGTASREPDPDWYETVHDHCDLLVVGSGPAGLAAAEAGVDAGLDVVLADQDFALGGDLLGAAGPVGEDDAEGWRAARLSRLRGAARLMARTTVFGLYDGLVAGLLERVTDGMADPPPDLPRERLRILRPRAVVLATGAIERPVAFGDNDRPGVMGAAAARSFAARHAVLPSARMVVATTNDGAYADAALLARAGAQVLLADARPAAGPAACAAAQAAGVEIAPGLVPVKAEGRMGVRGLWLGRWLGDGRARPERAVAADVVAVSGGWSPAIHLLSHRKVRPVWCARRACFLPGGTAEPIFVAGAAAGVWDAAGCAASGRAAGLAAARALGAWGGAIPNAPAADGWETPPAPVFEVRAEGWRLKSFVDPQHDVTADDIRLAHREGYVSVEHMKRYTTLGMATDQGKLGNVIGLALMAEALGRAIPEVGTTTFRPPYAPVSIGALAGAERGARWRPTRLTPMHAQAEAAGAVFTDAGLWRRAWYFPQGAEGMAEAARREAAMVRARVGFVDVSTLGKIAVQGPDAAAFLDRVYVNGFAALPVGRARYGVMLRDDGIAMDDGSAWRLAEDRFMVTTTTANAGAVMQRLETLLQTRWTDLRVDVASESDHWAGLAIAGPLAREAMARLFPDLDLSDAAYPFMAARAARFAGAEARTARLSFSGERAWEAFVPADLGPALWAAAAEACAALGGGPYGLEALDVLRVEKGHVTGREIDGRATLDDLGLGRMASRTKPFVGAVLRQRPELTRPDRPRLVGLRPAREGERFPAGAILCEPGRVRGHGVGWVSSVADSPRHGWIGLGFAAGGPEARAGAALIAADPTGGTFTEVVVGAPCIHDPAGERLRG